MARPRLGDSASKRLQMVITEDELEAIEDWQFANRVPSKSEAIRRLVQIGLSHSATFEDLKQGIFKHLEGRNGLERAILNYATSAKSRSKKVKDQATDDLIAALMQEKDASSRLVFAFLALA
ncbi:MAG TPA: hypothetical protein VGN98_02815, partial [Tianweitania sediminis]|nr:hypothetical protein [Tianweitania sediminis]